MVRLQKFLADAGVASRRASEELILAGKVKVNGKLVRLLGSKVDPDRDSISANGKRVRARHKLYVALNKPRRYVCTRKDERGRKTVHELLPKEWGILHSVGRLDYDSEGLLFLTNDGDFTLKLTHPQFGVLKKYLVAVDGRVDDRIVSQLRAGVVDQGERMQAKSVRVHESGRSGSMVELTLAEGKKREVRRMFSVLGLTVKRLLRIEIGRIKLGELRSGRWRTLTESEIQTLLKRI